MGPQLCHLLILQVHLVFFFLSVTENKVSARLAQTPGFGLEAWKKPDSSLQQGRCQKSFSRSCAFLSTLPSESQTYSGENIKRRDSEKPAAA